MSVEKQCLHRIAICIFYICAITYKNTKPLLIKKFFLLFISFFLVFNLIGQNFFPDGDFENLYFRNKKNEIQNGFAQLKLLDNDTWLRYSPENIKVYFEDGHSKYATINIDQQQYIQAQLCCFPTKGEFYTLSIRSTINHSSKNGIAFIKAYILAKPIKEGEEASVLHEVILYYKSNKNEWELISNDFESTGAERYILFGFIGDHNALLIENVNSEGYEDEILIDIQSVSLHLSSIQQGIIKASEKVEF